MKYDIFNFVASSWATHNTAACLKVTVRGSWRFNYIENEHLLNLETVSRQPTALSASSKLNFDGRNKLEIYDSRMCVHSTQRKKISLKNAILLLRISSHFVHRYTLPTGGNRKATCQSCVKNYLPELPDDYLPEQCNKIFFELLCVVPLYSPEERHRNILKT
jgi:hypothetical protein